MRKVITVLLENRRRSALALLIAISVTSLLSPEIASASPKICTTVCVTACAANGPGVCEDMGCQFYGCGTDAGCLELALCTPP